MAKNESIEWLPYCKLIKTDGASDHVRMLQRAYLNAAQSPDTSTQNGSVLVTREGENIDDYNHFPQNISITKSRLERPTKYAYIEHAERNVIYTAAKFGLVTNGARLYCTWYACTDCARAIIQAGIFEVIGHAEMFRNTPDRWKETIIKAFEMFKEAGVRCFAYDGKIFEDSSVSVLFNEKKWTP